MRGCRTFVCALVLVASACAERAPAVAPRDASWSDGRVRGGGGGLPPTGGTGTPTPTPTGECRARLLVIFDRSLSMEAPWDDGETSAPRWRVAASALERAIEPLAARLEIGAILFPSTPLADVGTCAPVDLIGAQLPYRDGEEFLAAWSTLWSDPELMGSTPLDSAFDSADAALAGSTLETAVVVLTDGEPTCSGDVAADARAAEWHARGIDTWVIGLPGSREAGLLDAIAIAGGTGASLPVSAPSELTDGLTRILGDAIEQACTP